MKSRIKTTSEILDEEVYKIKAAIGIREFYNKNSIYSQKLADEIDNHLIKCIKDCLREIENPRTRC